MKRLKEILNEIGDRPMNISKFDLASDGELRAEAINTDLNIDLELMIDLSVIRGDGHYVIDFEVNGVNQKTGEGNEIKVFSTVKTIMERWLNEWKDWSAIEFSASKDGSFEDNTGRERLYARFAKMLAKKYGAKVEPKEKPGYTVYVIKKNITESNAFQLNEIGDRPMNISTFNLMSDGRLFAQAKDPKLNIDLKLAIDQEGFADPQKFVVDFTVNDKNNQTGEGNEIKVFSTVKAIMERWFNEWKDWKVLSFSSFKDKNDPDDSGRQRLYARFANSFAKKFNAHVKRIEKDTETYYRIIR